MKKIRCLTKFEKHLTVAMTDRKAFEVSASSKGIDSRVVSQRRRLVVVRTSWNLFQNARQLPRGEVCKSGASSAVRGRCEKRWRALELHWADEIRGMCAERLNGLRKRCYNCNFTGRRIMIKENANSRRQASMLPVPFWGCAGEERIV